MTDLERLVRHQSAQIEYLQKRLDILQSCTDGLAELLVAVGAGKNSDDNPEQIRELTERYAAIYAETRKRQSARFSEFPFPDAPKSGE